MSFFLQGTPGASHTARGLLPPYTAADFTNLALTEVAPGFFHGEAPSKATGRYPYLIIFSEGAEDVGARTYFFDGTDEIQPSEAPDLTAITSVLNPLSTRASEARLVNLETVARTSTAATYRATGFATPANVTAARDTVITAGDARWKTSTLDAAEIWGYGGAGGRSLTEPVATDAASREASKADLTTLETQSGVLFGLVTPDGTAFSTEAMSNAPTGGTGGLNTEQNGWLSTLFNLVTPDGQAFKPEALVNVPQSAGGGLLSDERARLFAIPTNPLLATNYVAPPSLAAIQQAINETESAIIAEGSASWTTAVGFNTVAPDNGGILAAIEAATNAINDKPVTPATDLQPVLTAIADKPVTPAVNVQPVIDAVDAAKVSIITQGNAAWKTALAVDESAIAQAVTGQISTVLATIEQNTTEAKKRLSNDVFVDLDNALVTTMDDDGTTPLFRFQTLNAEGQPSVTNTIRRVRVNLDD